MSPCRELMTVLRLTCRWIRRKGRRRRWRRRCAKRKCSRRLKPRERKSRRHCWTDRTRVGRPCSICGMHGGHVRRTERCMFRSRRRIHDRHSRGPLLGVFNIPHPTSSTAATCRVLITIIIQKAADGGDVPHRCAARGHYTEQLIHRSPQNKRNKKSRHRNDHGNDLPNQICSAIRPRDHEDKRRDAFG